MIRFVKVSFGASVPGRGIRQVSLHLPRGSMGCVVGPMGAGKTLVVRLCAGWLIPDEGGVLIDGRDTREMGGNELKRLRRAMGIASPDLPLLETCSVADNARASLEARGALCRRAIRASLHTLERLGALHLASALPRDLSSGERRLVSLARAAAFRPAILVADEPLEALPPAHAARAMDLLSDLVVAGSCVLIATRDGAAAPPGCRVWPLHRGILGPYELVRPRGSRASALVEALVGKERS